MINHLRGEDVESQVILITGSSKGIGKLTALELSRRGKKVYASMRNPVPFEQPENNLIVDQLDVTDARSVQSAVERIIEKEGRIDGVVNNAGYGLLAPVDEATENEVQHQFDVNVFGVMRVIKAVLPQMRKQKYGRIINLSSVAGIVSNPGLGWYCATKHALEAMSASLASTVFPWNITVSVVQPAATATGFAEDLTIGGGEAHESPYGDFTERYRERMVGLLKEGQPPEEVASLIANILDEPNPHFRYQTSGRVKNIASQIVVDPTGDQWLNQQKETFADWFNV